MNGKNPKGVGVFGAEGFVVPVGLVSSLITSVGFVSSTTGCSTGIPIISFRIVLSPSVNVNSGKVGGVVVTGIVVGTVAGGNSGGTTFVLTSKLISLVGVTDVKVLVVGLKVTLEPMSTLVSTVDTNEMLLFVS